MQLPSISNRMIAGAGIEAIENRVRQIEGLIQSIEHKNTAQNVDAPPKSFQAYLKEAAGKPDDSLKSRMETFQPLVEKYSQHYGVDKTLINAVIRQESGFNPTAVSKAGAIGLMQLMPATAKGLGVTDATNPAQNVEAGVRHLKGLLDQYRGNIALALAAYNAGAGAVQKYGGIPPYQETQNYVRNILSMYLKDKYAQPS